MDEPQKRRWYSFRWQILFWIALPFIVISLSDFVVMWLASRNARQ